MRSLIQMTDSAENEQLFEISAVSRLTGISTPNIRVWERRHQVVEPKRSESRRRLYTAEDIRRLTLLKGLVDRGHAIGTIATLRIEQLEERLGVQEDADLVQGAKELTGPCRLLVIGEALKEQFKETNFVPGAQVEASFGTLEEAKAWSGIVDVVLIECATLFEESIAVVQELVKSTQAHRAVVVYRYTQQATLRLIDQGISGVTPLRAPVKASELRVVLQADVSLATRKPSPKRLPLPPREEQAVPPRHYTDKQLAKASHISTAIDCECPQHLGNLLTNLVAFEKYSAECESRNEEDEALHRFLYETTARARAMMEHALQEVVETEGLTI